MYPTPLQFAEITGNQLTTNSTNVVSPTIWVTRKDSQRGYRKSPLIIDERTVAVLVAMAASGEDFVDLRKFSVSHGKRNNRKNLAGRPATDRHTTRHLTRKNMNSTMATSSSNRVGKSPTISGAHQKIQKRRVSNKKVQREGIERKEGRASQFDLKNHKKAKEAVDGLVGLMEGFGIGGGEKAENNMDIDMNGLEKQMAMLEVIHEGDEEAL